MFYFQKKGLDRSVAMP